jgi:hypothetical protein
MRWAEKVVRMGKMKNVHKKFDARETGWELVDWIHLAQDREQ